VEVKTRDCRGSVDNKISYLNTDLDLRSASDLSDLGAYFETQGMWLLHVTKSDDGTWYATIETEVSYDEPAKNIDAILNAIESMPAPHQHAWSNCSIREFNVGYDCGDEPWAYNQAISSDLLGRLAKVGGSLRITLYPDRSAEP
jgi:hypothetical protein